MPETLSHLQKEKIGAELQEAMGEAIPACASPAFNSSSRAQGTKQSPEGHDCFYPADPGVFCAAQHWVSAGLMRHPHTLIVKQQLPFIPLPGMDIPGGATLSLRGFPCPLFLSLSFPKLEKTKTTPKP